MNSQDDLNEIMFIPTRDTFKNLGMYIRLAIPTIAMYSIGQLAWEIHLLFASRLSVAETATHVIMQNLCSLFYSVAVGIQQSSGVIVGRYLG